MKDKQIFFHSLESNIFKHLDIEFIITSRFGGFSNTPQMPHQNSLNLGYHVGDDPILVSKNRSKISSLFHPQKPLVWVNQVHGDKVIDANHTYDKSEILLGDGDGIFCTNHNIKALIMVADCAGILLYEATTHRFLLLHAGRAGALNKIITKAIKTHGLDPINLYAYITPHIHACCYEIQENLAANLPQESLVFKDNKIFFNLTQTLESELKNLGVMHIEISDTCTCCMGDALFSYRRAVKNGLKNTGRFGIIATLKP